MIPPLYLAWNAFGIFPLPHESEKDFCLRVETLLACAQDVDAQQEVGIKLVQSLYGAYPSWVPVVCSNSGLAPWEAACTWCGDGPPTIQISHRFAHSTLFTKLYHYSEVLAHEYVHAIRYALNSSFDEFFAYFVTGDSFRARCSALFAYPYEVVLLLVSLFLPTLFFLFDLSATLSVCAFFIPLALVAYYALRTWCKKRVWKNCLGNLRHVVSRSLELCVRLTDDEIILFSRLRPSEITEWIKQAATRELRWKVFSVCYFDTM